MTQPEIDLMERGKVLENLTKKVEELLPQLEKALAATPASQESDIKAKVVELSEAMAKLKEGQDVINDNVAKAIIELESGVTNLKIAAAPSEPKKK